MWTFRLLDTGAGAPEDNMALDEAILIEVGRGASPPTIRFYAWNRPTVSLGYFQRAAREIDEAAVVARKYGLVRRMTGGRSVLHDREVTYSVIVPVGHELAQTSVVESFRILSGALREGFCALGLSAEVVSLADENEREKFQTLGSAACFDSPSWYELVVNGRKIAGSAQVRAHGGLLQHGSLVLDMRPEDLFSVLLLRDGQDGKRLRAAFSERATGVKQLSGRDVAYREAVTAFQSGFAAGLPARLTLGLVTDEEAAQARQLARDKYGAREWTFRR